MSQKNNLVSNETADINEIHSETQLSIQDCLYYYNLNSKNIKYTLNYIKNFVIKNLNICMYKNGIYLKNTSEFVELKKEEIDKILEKRKIDHKKIRQTKFYKANKKMKFIDLIIESFEDKMYYKRRKTILSSLRCLINISEKYNKVVKLKVNGNWLLIRYYESDKFSKLIKNINEEEKLNKKRFFVNFTNRKNPNQKITPSYNDIKDLKIIELIDYFIEIQFDN